MPVNTLDIGSAWANVGKQMFGGQAAYTKGQTEMGRLLADQYLRQSQAEFNNEKIGELRRKAQFQTPEFATNFAKTLSGLTTPQGMELDSYQRNGTWTAPLPDDQAGPPMPTSKAPEWARPEVLDKFNAAKGLFLGGLAGNNGIDEEKISRAITELTGTNLAQDRALNRGYTNEQLQALNGFNAADKGTAYHQGGNGVMSQITGQETINPVGLSAAAENKAQAASAYAAADQHRAGAELARSKVGQPTVMMGPDGVPVEVSSKPVKPMPAAALKLQQEEMDAINTSANMNQQLSRFFGDIESGKLMLGPMENIKSKARNFAGASSENSRNFASFNAMLEKIRNDSLRLNKGVQTEGDAVRAWNELVSNANDPQVVTQRLKEIMELNERAKGYRQMNLDVIRSNYGHPPMELAGKAEKVGTGVAVPKIQRGQVIDGYRFKGGNPAAQSNWEPVK